MISKDINIKDDTNWYSLLDLVHPIGSIYCSTKSTSPASLMGGTWSAINGKFLLGTSSTYTLGATGGEASHTLTSSEMPSHNHATNVRVQTSYPTGRVNGTNGWLTDGDSPMVYTSYSGSGRSHNNMPPYQAVSIWERTA